MHTTAFRPLAVAIVVLAWVALVLVAIGVGSRPAAAQGQGEGATVISEGGCGLLEPGVPHLFTTDLHSVITPSGNTMLICHFEGPPIPETVVGKGFPCGTFFGGTTESRFVYTKSGKVTEMCRINPGG